MSQGSLPAHNPGLLGNAGVLQLDQKSLAFKVGAVVLGTLALALASRIEVPMVPVPVTMQTFAIAMIGALYGARLGTMTVLAWLGEAMMGLPVLAGGAGGVAHFAGPTGGYLASFPLMALLVGLLTERGWNAQRPLLAFSSMLAANALCLTMGAIWLAGMIGIEKAFLLGVAPFVVGAILKSALGAASLAALSRFAKRGDTK
ncbi:biotin transporter BioY [Nitratireductor kimnyeongensis]|uniref:Biotin transporter n=1 Tax=Nitratireductor kimnyeongensis TaxID=430679 RepID=A0ABW0T994_9HYPH|nr:biotin transporter BioY [Nitratireductor kimnyeongensis]QZZ36066.1 biotin transporter BioY [Nitratireductor kimnyeongensis]